MVGWLVLVVVGASGAKSTVLPILVGATATALVWAVVTRSRSIRPLAVAAGGLLVLQGLILTVASGSAGGRVVVLGTLKILPAYTGLVDDRTLRGLNDGLVLDSIRSPRNLLYAVLAVVVSLAIHGYRLAGLLILTRRTGRADVVNWWLSGAICAGFGLTLVIDHMGSSQEFFAMTVIPLGSALTVTALWQATRGWGHVRRQLVLWATASGCVLTLLLEYFVRERQSAGGYGALDRLLFPMLLLAVVAVAAIIARRRLQCSAGTTLAIFLTVVIGAVVPSQVDSVARAAYRWVQPVEYPSDEEHVDFLTTGELESMMWLRSNTGDSEVTVTNVHCRPLDQQGPLCDARGFWVVGLSGRRSVLEGWAYTREAKAAHGVGGRIFSRQLSPFVERAGLIEALFDGADLDALRKLRDDYDARWIVVAHRAGPVPAVPATIASVRFENGEVTILEIAE
ncbi:hypothetical protein [Ilumatobacter sp.]|uniref:hypothetical protein n=1 Tax=Ilumatobacter sp. TaxID=1967498 RepID=UPI003AF6501D